MVYFEWFSRRGEPNATELRHRCIWFYTRLMPEFPDSRRKLFEKVSLAHPAGRHPPSQTLGDKPSEETTLFKKAGFPPDLLP
jgi:hypothetical protein